MLTPEVTREDLTVFEEHWDDVPSCEACEEPAKVTTRKVCCPVQYSYCSLHFAVVRAWVVAHLKVGIDCTRCHAQFTTPQTFTDVFTVVTL